MEFFFAATCSEKIRPEKCPFIAKNKLIVLAVRRSVKYFSLQIPRRFRKSCGEKKKKAASYKALCFLGKRNNSKFSHTIVSPMRNGIF